MAVETWSPLSECIASVDYNDDTEVASVSFVKGGTYNIEGMPPSEFESWKSAPSAGGFWNSIRGKYAAKVG